MSVPTESSVPTWWAFPLGEVPILTPTVLEGPRTVGMRFHVIDTAWLYTIGEFRVSDEVQPTGCGLYQLGDAADGSDAALLATAAWTLGEVGEWNSTVLDTPIRLEPGNTYVVAVLHPRGAVPVAAAEARWDDPATGWDTGEWDDGPDL